MSPPSIDILGVPASKPPISALKSPLTVDGVPARRQKSGKLVAGVAASCDSDMFKSISHGKPKAKRWDHRLNLEATERKMSSLKSMAKYLKIPGLISLGGGLPSSQYFPIESLDIKVAHPPDFSEAATKESGVVSHTGKYDAAEDKGIYDLSIALNYGIGFGSAQLLRFVTEHTEIVNNPPYEDWQCALTVGSTSALDMAFRMFLNRGDCVLSEEYTFATAVETAAPMGVKTVGIKMDAQGLLPDSMDEILSNWDAAKRGSPKPFLLYTVPSGQNPTGATQGEQRRREIYKVAQKHDVYILEDEPYYFLQMQPYTGQNQPDAPVPSSHDEFLKALVPTLLSMDTDGRVMRMDSFSKVIAPGTRVGWITASQQIVERFVRHNEFSVQNPSGISQIVLFKLLDEQWGHGGYLDWLLNLRLEYTKRRDVILGACEKYLPKDIVSWDPPMAGMFLWMKVNHRKHPMFDIETPLEIEKSIFDACIERGVLVSRGSFFRASPQDELRDMFFRATFAAAENEKMVEAIKRFGEAVEKCFEAV